MADLDIAIDNFFNENPQLFYVNQNEDEGCVKFDFIEQPKQYHRFRYISDIEKSSHGVLLSVNSTAHVKKYPTVKLELPQNNLYPTDLRFFILCVLCEPSQTNDPENSIRLSPHRLVQKVKSAKGKSKNYDISYKPLSGLMEQSNGNTNVYTFNLEDYFILRTVIDQQENAVIEKYEKLKANNWQIDNIIEISNATNAQNNESAKTKKRKSKSNQNKIESVCLCFTVYLKFGEHYQRFIGPIKSNPIINGETIRVHKICNPFGSIKGNDDVTLLVQNAKNNDFKVHIFEIDDNNQTVWSKEIDEKLTEFFPFAISFKTPKYDRINYDKTKKEIQCYIKVQRKSDESFSEGVKFLYKNYQTDAEIGPERKKARFNANSTIQTDSISSIVNNRISVIQPQQQFKIFTDSINIEQKLTNDENEIETTTIKIPLTLEKAVKEIKNIAFNKTIEREIIIKKLDDLNNAYMDQQQTEYTIYHEIIKNDKKNLFLKIYTILDAVKISEPLQSAILDDGDTLLHTVCKLNKSEYIRPLIGHRCSIVSQNVEGNTPLHIAIQKRNLNCIERFKDIMNELEEYPHIRNEFQKLLQIYNQQGHTILHLAVLCDLPDFVENILAFCKREQLLGGACAEVLGNGNTIMHLAVVNNLLEMVRIIMKYLPEAVNFENYGGFTALNMNIERKLKVNTTTSEDIKKLIEGIKKL